MSKKETIEVNCSGCGEKQDATVWYSLNTSLDPEAKQLLLAGKVNVFHCRKCPLESFLPVEFLYHDMDKRFCVQFIPPEQMNNDGFFKRFTPGGELAAGPNMPEEFRERLTQDAPHILRPHFVFSMDELITYVVFRDRLVGEHPDSLQHSSHGGDGEETDELMEERFRESFIVRCPTCLTRSDDPIKRFDIGGFCQVPDVDYVLWECTCHSCAVNFDVARWTTTSNLLTDEEEFDQRLLLRYRSAIEKFALMPGEERSMGGRPVEFKGTLEIETEFLNIEENKDFRKGQPIIPIEGLTLARGMRKAAIHSPGRAFGCTIGPFDLVISLDQDNEKTDRSFVMHLEMSNRSTRDPLTNPQLNFAISLFIGKGELSRISTGPYMFRKEEVHYYVPWQVTSNGTTIRSLED